MKLQNAYISEKGDKVGNWYLIGYNGPGDWTISATTKTSESGAQTKSTNFTYEDALAPNALSAMSSTKALAITNNAKLNDCDAAENWTVSISAGAEGTAAGEAVYSSKVAAGCLALTPNFEAIK